MYAPLISRRGAFCAKVLFPLILKSLVLLLPCLASAGQLVVRSNYSALVLYYNPHVVKDGQRMRVKDAYKYRDIDQLCRDYCDFLRKASGGQVNFSVAFRYELDEYPPEADPDVTFTPENFDQYRREGYDMFNRSKADYHAICADKRFQIVPKVEAGQVDAVWIFGPDCTGFWEAAMAGSGAYWVNGGPYPDIKCSRKFVMFGFGMAGHQGVGFMLENTGHMIENIMCNQIASGWPARHSATGWNTLDLTNPERASSSRKLNDWDFFTSTDSVHWNVDLVVPGGSQAGLSHFPPTACVNYGWSAPRLNFEVPWEAEALRSYGGEWRIANGVYTVGNGSGRSMFYGSHNLKDSRGDYQVPVIVTDADIETGVTLRGASEGHAGLLVRCAKYGTGTNCADGYYVGVNPSADRIELAKVSNAYQVLESCSVPLADGTNVPLFISLRGRELRVALSKHGSPVLVYKGLERKDGAIGFANYGSDASFTHLHVTPVIRNNAESWRTYPNLNTNAWDTLSPLEWTGDDKPYSDMDYWYGWWYEHLPKNPGTHEVRDPQTGKLLGKALNSWWPYLFDINVFDKPLLEAATTVVSVPLDTTAPEPPTDFAVSALSPTKARLQWSEPKDNVGVTRYEIYRDGKLIRRTPLKSFDDATLSPNSEHEYFVKARDGSGNVSPASKKVAVRTLSPSLNGI